MSAVGARERPSGRREDWPPLRYGQTRSRWIKTCKREKQMTSDLGKKKISKATQETRVEEMRRPEAGWPQGHLDRQAAARGPVGQVCPGPPRGRVSSTPLCRNIRLRASPPGLSHSSFSLHRWMSLYTRLLLRDNFLLLTR